MTPSKQQLTSSVGLQHSPSRSTLLYASKRIRPHLSVIQHQLSSHSRMMWCKSAHGSISVAPLLVGTFISTIILPPFLYLVDHFDYVLSIGTIFLFCLANRDGNRYDDDGLE